MQVADFNSPHVLIKHAAPGARILGQMRPLVDPAASSRCAEAACKAILFTIRSHAGAAKSILPNEPVMADQIVITEKSSQAKDVRAAVGSRYGDILPAEGHLFDLLEPEDVVPAWKRWSPILLRPKAFTALARQRAATKPPSSGPFARPCAPPNGFGSPPTAIGRVSSSVRKFSSITNTVVR